VSRFKHAIVRTPSTTFAKGLTTSPLGAPSLELALEQHFAYRQALTRCGLSLTVLEEAKDFPDSTFVEDVAIVKGEAAILTLPGAPSRRGEVALIRETLSKHFASTDEIVAPGTLDGGDVCDAGDHFFIGLSARTNEHGATQLARWLTINGYSSSFIDIRNAGALLHLKTGLACLGDETMVAVKELLDHPSFRHFKVVAVSEEERYAADCLRINDRVILPTGNPKLMAALVSLGHSVDAVDVSEFRKMDGGLSCLSLRY
jgi:dimethylargininase